MSDRGFIERRLDVTLGEREYVVFITSADTEEVPLPTKKVTYGRTFLTAYVIKPVEEEGKVIGSHLIFVN